MPKLTTIPLFSRVCMYILVGLLGLFFILVLFFQFQTLSGKPFENPDGSVDDWREQKLIYGIAFADIFLACPLGIIGAIFIFFGSRWGFYIFSLVNFWYLWANIMTTSTSIRFESPTISFMWFITFPFGSILSLLFVVWTFIYFDKIYSKN